MAAAALAFVPDASLDLGDGGRVVHGVDEAAQRTFRRGQLQMYAFHHEEALRCFEHVAKRYPACVLAHWFAAHCCAPNYNNQDVDDEAWALGARHMQAAVAAAATAPAAASTAAGATASCATAVLGRALVEAGRHRFPLPRPPTAEGRLAVMRTFAVQVEALLAQFPDDGDVACLVAEAWMNLRPWKLWTADGQPQPDTEKIVGLLEQALEKFPTHSGLCHFYIHAMEMSPHLERPMLLDVCKRLPAISPDAGHLIHMPTHIYVQIGRYGETVELNEQAIVADLKTTEALGRDPFFTLYRAHNYHFVVFGGMFAGNYNKSIKAARDLVQQIPDSLLVESGMADWLEPFVPLFVHVLVRFGRWEELLAEPFPADRELHCTSVALLHYGRGIARAVRGEVTQALDEQRLMRAAIDHVVKSRVLFNNTMADILAVADAMLQGEIEYRQQDYHAAFETLGRAVVLDDSLPYDEPWAWMQPARHALGALLLEQGWLEAAERVYRDDLAKHPDNCWSLRGLLGCLDAHLKDDKSTVEDEKRMEVLRAEHQQLTRTLDRVQSIADVPVLASCFCAAAAGEKVGTAP
eukprot:m.134537 g.134537  ORF g.134537 m.134537 type:complete len:579 (-) comp16916_c0_seq1:94-1830(-)